MKIVSYLRKLSQKKLTITAIVCTIFIGLPSFYLTSAKIYEKFFATIVTLDCKKFIRGQNVLYLVNLNNPSTTIHAEEITFKVIFSEGKIKLFEIFPNIDIYSESDIKQTNDGKCAEFSLKRLSSTGLCDVHIILHNTNKDIDETITVSWKNRGIIRLKPQIADDNAMRQFNAILDFHEKTSDLSFKARTDRFKSNTRGIIK